MASRGKVRKREWGKPRDKPNVVILENMELEKRDPSSGNSQVFKSVTEGSSNDKMIKTCIDLQYPELLSTDQLVSLLCSYHVPIPVYSDGSPSRERVLYLYNKHVLPRPQRLRQQLRRKKFHQKVPVPVAMETDDKGLEWMSTEEVVKWEEPLGNRKRTSTMSNSDSSCLPLSKKPLVTIATSTPPRKLKRPVISHFTNSDDSKSLKVNKIT